MIGLFALTPAARRAAAELAARLGPDAVLADGPLGPVVRRMWPQLDAAVFFLAAGEAVRVIAPLLRDRQTDPGVVCVDEQLRFAIALDGGHDAGANALAEQVADVLGCTPVVTTVPGGGSSSPWDEVVDLLDATVDGDIAACGAAVLDGERVLVVNPHGFPLPALPDNVGTDVDRPLWTVVVDDRLPGEEDSERTVRLVPRTLVVGVGSRRGVARSEVTELVARLARDHDLDLRAVRAFATVDDKADEHGVVEAVQDLGFWHAAEAGDELPLLRYPAAELAGVEVPNPSDAVAAHTGTPSVAEAAALRAAGELGPAELVVGKITGENVVVAAARTRPRGRLAAITLGPAPDLRTPRAEAELRRAAVVVDPDHRIDEVRHLLRPGTDVRPGTPEDAVSLALKGNAVALLGELTTAADLDLIQVPGISG
ncbi:cobalamin biosynthesis protein [Saccharopolyspora taberi]|uniref:Precorrin-3B C(17)-methyltransferase n=1 Tax=Saccharopolyspora taberi TaxID=60895 RepID=A0ABN3VMY9_9PSEU